MAEKAFALTGKDGEKLVPTFGFGSNSVRQLRGRLDHPGLLGYPAKVRGAALAFAGPNYTWACGGDACGTATLIPMPGEVALGTMAFLTEDQLQTLDGFEGVPWVYDRRPFEAEVLHQGCWRTVEAIAYVKVNSEEWYAPSEAYCCAVLRNIRGSFPSVTELTLRDTAGAEQGRWRHPGYAGLGVPGLLFEVGVRKQEPWVLPRAISGYARAFQAADVTSGLAARDALGQGQALGFDGEELSIARRLLGKGEEDRELSDDDAQAEQACIPGQPEQAAARGTSPEAAPSEAALPAEALRPTSEAPPARPGRAGARGASPRTARSGAAPPAEPPRPAGEARVAEGRARAQAGAKAKAKGRNRSPSPSAGSRSTSPARALFVSGEPISVSGVPIRQRRADPRRPPAQS